MSRPLPGADMNCFLEARLRDQRLRLLLRGFAWTFAAAMLALLVISLNV